MIESIFLIWLIGVIVFFPVAALDGRVQADMSMAMIALLLWPFAIVMHLASGFPVGRKKWNKK